MGHIYVLEFGGQHTDLIGNRLEEMGFSVRYAESNVRASDLYDASGTIISGGPKSVNDADRFPYDPNVFGSVPTLGICYGMQLLGKTLGADVHRRTREYGETILHISGSDDLIEGLGTDEVVWMNHGDSITPGGKFDVLGYTEKNVPAIIRSGSLYGVQFHPEVTHTEHGKTLLRNFAEKICGCVPEKTKNDDFDAGKFIDEAVSRLRDEAGDRKALVYASGGVDSTVASRLSVIAGLDVMPVYLEMGNGRRNEAAEVSRILKKILGKELYVHDRAKYFMRGLRGIDDPEDKRKAFVRLYARTREELERAFGLDEYVVIQGSIATDRRETGKEAGKHAAHDANTVATIKTHHNVGAEDSWKKKTVAPLAELTKDRVRMVARELGIPKEVSERQPFPGPGLYVRFVTGLYMPEHALVDQTAEILGGYNIHGCVLPRKGVGLKGDERAFEHAVMLAGERDWKKMRRAGKQLTEDLDVSRVLYYPKNTRLKQGRFLYGCADHDLNRRNIDRLKEVTYVVEQKMDEYNVRSSQTPVISFGGPDGWINVIRDVDSKDFRTLRPLKKPEEFPWACYDSIVKALADMLGSDAGQTVFDISDKPGGTTEWQ